MHVEEVDPVGAEALQTRIDRLRDIGASAATPVTASAILPNLVASTMSFRRAPRTCADEFLRLAAAAIDVGGVEVIDADGDRAVDDLARRIEVDAAAEIVAAEADQRDAQIGRAERAEFHGGVPCRGKGEVYGWPRMTSTEASAPPLNDRHVRATSPAMDLIVKICGLSTPVKIDAALHAGADMVGLNFFRRARASSRSNRRNARRRWRPDGGITVLTVDMDEEGIAEIVRRCGRNRSAPRP